MKILEEKNTTQVLSHLDYDTPRIMQIRKEANKRIEKYKRKIKILQQKERRHKQKITNLQDLLKSLKNKYCLQENELNVIGNIGKCNENLFKRLLKKSLKKLILKTYTPELRSFALTLLYTIILLKLTLTFVRNCLTVYHIL